MGRTGSAANQQRGRRKKPEELKVFTDGLREEVKANAKENGLTAASGLRVAPIPYGQWQKKKLTKPMKRRIRQYWKDRKWPEGLLSFEAWCAMTCYDYEEEDGGEAFQKLMGALLAPAKGGDGMPEKLTKQLKTEYTVYNAETRAYGKYAFDNSKLKTKDWTYRGCFSAGEFYVQSPVGDEKKLIALGQHTSASSRILIQPKGNKLEVEAVGLEKGLENTSSSPPVGNPKNAPLIDHEGNAVGTTPYWNQNPLTTPYGKFDWMRKGLFTGFGEFNMHLRGESNGSAADVVSGGVAPSYQALRSTETQKRDVVCNEANFFEDDDDFPCVTIINQIAAIYGLYYYPGCRDDDLNWAVTQKVEGTNQKFTVRMRCPNPRYAMPKPSQSFEDDGSMWFEQAKEVNPENYPMQAVKHSTKGTDKNQNEDRTERLFVYEPLNDFNARALTAHYDNLVEDYNARTEEANKVNKDKAAYKPKPFLRAPAKPWRYVGGPHLLQEANVRPKKGSNTKNHHNNRDYTPCFAIPVLAYNRRGRNPVAPNDSQSFRVPFPSHFMFLGVTKTDTPGKGNTDQRGKYVSGPFYRTKAVPLLRDAKKKIIPYTGEQRQPLYQDRSFAYGDALRNVPNMRIVQKDPKDNLDFGFRISQAFLLYPYTTNDEVKEKADQKPTKDAPHPGYMPLPTKKNRTNIVKYMEQLKDGVSEHAEEWQRERPLAKHILNWNEWEDLNANEFRRKLLAVEGAEEAPEPAPPEPAPPEPAPARRRRRGRPTAENATRPTSAVVEGVTTRAAAIVPAETPAAAEEDEPDRFDQQLQGRAYGEVPNPAPDVGGEDDAMESNARQRDEENTAAAVESAFGVPGHTNASTVNDCMEHMSEPYTEQEIRREATLIRANIGKGTQYEGPKSNSVKDAQRRRNIVKALKECGLDLRPLPPGSLHRFVLEKDLSLTPDKMDLQCHWQSSQHMPWSYNDIYFEGRLQLVYEADDNDTVPRTSPAVALPGEDAVVEAGDGISPSNNVLAVKGVKLEWGDRKIRDDGKNTAVLDTPIQPKAGDPLEDLYILNYAKILCIFLSENGVHRYSYEQKQAGMCYGLWRDDKGDVVPGPKPAKGATKWKQVFKRVFDMKPNEVKETLGKPLLTCLAGYMCDSVLRNSAHLDKCLRDKNGRHIKARLASLRNIPSSMTVGDWVHTPWHLMHLPYQTQTAIFRDGEGYGEGCLRCARPFYEYAYHVYANTLSILKNDKTLGWPYDLWVPNVGSAKERFTAPRPLHDPIFFSAGTRSDDTPTWDTAVQKTERCVPQTVPQDVIDRDREEGVTREDEFEAARSGPMAWPEFLLRDKSAFATFHQNRAGMADPKEKKKCTAFRRFYNQAYSFDRAGGTDRDDKQKWYRKDYCQGYMFGGNSRAQLGQEQLRLPRAFKYSNLCRDCANVLDRAPGLLLRNNRYQFAAGAIQNNQTRAVQDDTYDYWTDLLKTSDVAAGTDPKDADKREKHGHYKMDAAILQGLQAWAKEAKDATIAPRQKGVKRPHIGIGVGLVNTDEIANYQEAFERVRAQLNTTLDKVRRPPDGWTRLVEAPQIHMQEAISYETTANNRRTKATEDLDGKNIDLAIRTLEKLLNAKPTMTLASALGTDAAKQLTNNKFREVLYEARRRYQFLGAYTKIDVTKQFDSELKRQEFRNAQIVYRMIDGEATMWWVDPPSQYTEAFTEDKKMYQAKYDLDGTERPILRLPYSGRRFGNLTKSRYITGRTADNKVYDNCLIVDQYDPAQLTKEPLQSNKVEDYRLDVYLATRYGPTGQQARPYMSMPIDMQRLTVKRGDHNRSWDKDDADTAFQTQWVGDGFACRKPDADDAVWLRREGQEQPEAINRRPTQVGNVVRFVADHRPTPRVDYQVRDRKQTRVMIPYSLQKPITATNEGKIVLEQMAKAVRKLFGEDQYLSEMLCFGKKLVPVSGKADAISSMRWDPIDRTRKDEAMANFYGGSGTNAYLYDTFETHVEKVDVVGGVEIGPKMGFPHFHVLLTVDHYSYVQFDSYRMKMLLEIMFKGVETRHKWGTAYMLPNQFYGDNENPYVDVTLHAADNYKEVLACYVKKTTLPSIVEVEAARSLPGTAAERREAAEQRNKVMGYTI